MELLSFILVVALLLGATIVFIRYYEPKLDMFKSRNKYVLLFWYNKYDWTGTYVTRAYIKLFEV